MFSFSGRRAVIAVLLCCLSTGFTHHSVRADAASTDRVEAALARMHAWLGDGENGRRWRTYLMSERIDDQLGQGEYADAEALAGPLSRFRSDAKGLDHPKFRAVRNALAAWRESLQKQRASDLVALARSSGEEFSPVRPDQLAAVRRELESRVDRLDAYLASGGANGQAWKQYLRFDQLRQQVTGQGPGEVSALAEVYRQFRAVHEGLELPVFADVAESLERYVNLANIARVQNQADQYARQLELLASELQAYQEEANEERAFLLGLRTGFIDGLGQAPRLVQAVRQRFARPNLRAQVSEGLLAAANARSINDTRQVTDVILGTYLVGPATTEAQLSSRTVSSGGGRGRIDLLLQGVVHSDMVGRNGPVRIYSTGETSFRSQKTIGLDRHGLHLLPACTAAVTHTDIHCIEPVKNGIGSGMIERIAWKRAGRQKSQAEAIAADHAEDRISGNFNGQATDLLAEAQGNYQRDFRLPLLRRKEFPEHFDVRTSSDGLTLTVVQATRSQLAAPNVPPLPNASHDLALAVHESLPNNVANSWLSGYRLTDDWLRAQLLEAGRDVPPELETDEEPWSLTFTNQRPVSVTFDGGGFAVTVRGRRFTSGDRAYGAMNIAVRYQFETTAEGILLRRQGELEILPPGFQPGVDRLSAEQSALREILIKRLSEVLKEEIKGQGVELPGELARVGTLMPVEATSEGGWLRLGWNRSVARTVVARRD